MRQNFQSYFASLNNLTIEEFKKQRWVRLSKDLGLSASVRKEYIDIFEDWQSSRTKALKRFILGISLLIIGAAYIGSDLTTLSPLGLQTNKNSGYLLAQYLMGVTLVSWIMYEFAFYVDKARRNALKRLKDKQIGRAITAYEEINKAAKQYNMKPNELIKELSGDDRSESINHYNFISEQLIHIARPRTIDIILRYVDSWVIRILVLITFASLMVDVIGKSKYI